MRILADENTEAQIVDWLRKAGHDVLWAAEFSPGASDEALLEKAAAESRIILTADLDFGELVFRRHLKGTGIVLLRLRAETTAELLRSFEAFWPAIEKQAHGKFLVVTNRKVRIRELD
ncbi:MAG: DUF5615 family PIN-like protein [Candidatus Sumerlaeaceae bacterium]|nr:DUF5615 family PIN-like protein [Candidatus Sumerlaeaceae bacterium]